MNDKGFGTAELLTSTDKYHEVRGLEQSAMDILTENNAKLGNSIRGISLSNANYSRYMNSVSSQLGRLKKQINRLLSKYGNN